MAHLDKYPPRRLLGVRHELRAADAVTSLFGSASFRLPDLVRGLVDAIYPGGHRYEFHNTVSSSTTDDPKHFAELSGNLVVVGAAARNSRMPIPTNCHPASGTRRY